jgi:hypothetical protein
MICEKIIINDNTEAVKDGVKENMSGDFAEKEQKAYTEKHTPKHTEAYTGEPNRADSTPTTNHQAHLLYQALWNNEEAQQTQDFLTKQENPLTIKQQAEIDIAELGEDISDFDTLHA